VFLRDPDIQRDPEAALRKWRRRQVRTVVIGLAALVGVLIGGANEMMVAVVVVGTFAIQSVFARFVIAAQAQIDARRYLG
jgi:hypothetical protein